MNYLANIDYAIIITYFVALVAIGFILKRNASRSIEHYFIGGRNLPWWAMGLSGMAQWLDISGTLLIVSFLYLLGPRGMFIEFRGGVGLVLVVMLLWSGKWHRRSGVMTGSDWMIFRFGDGLGGRFAELAKVLAALVGLIGELGYLIVGAGLFFSMFLPFSPLICALILVGVATLYTMLSGFYGVVVSNIFQSFIIIIGIVYISIAAYSAVPDKETLSTVAAQVTGNKDWISSIPHWRTHMPAGYEAFEYLFMFMLFYLLRNVFIGMGMGDDPKYFGSRNERECGTMTLTWMSTLMFRWPMVMGFAVLGIMMIQQFFPDQTVLVQAAGMIKAAFPDIAKENWATLLSQIANHSSQIPAQLVGDLQNLLGGDWQQKLSLVSFEGTVNPERIVPGVLIYNVQTGFRGLMMVALMAAGISTFNGNVNWAGSFFVRNVYQRYLRPRAKNREIINISYLTTLTIVVIAFLFAFTIESINDVWGWIAMSIGGGILIPTFLRLYWWRFNGSGFAAGMFTGVISAVVQRIFVPDLDDITKFLIILALGLAGTIIGTYLGPPTEKAVLENFYLKTRPFGFWKPFEKLLTPDEHRKMKREHRNDISAVPFGFIYHVFLFLMPMQLIIHNFSSFWITLAIWLVGVAGLYWFWYRNLPAREQ